MLESIQHCLEQVQQCLEQGVGQEIKLLEVVQLRARGEQLEEVLVLVEDPTEVGVEAVWTLEAASSTCSHSKETPSR